jgi:hypothetical protein
MIKIDFEKTDGTYYYRDALWLPEDHTYTDADLETMKQQRFDRWIAVVTAPPVDLPPDPAAVPAEGV